MDPSPRCGVGTGDSYIEAAGRSRGQDGAGGDSVKKTKRPSCADF
jgi:hypothetical protein